MAQYGKEFLLTDVLTELTLGLATYEGLQIANATICNTSASAVLVTINRASAGGVSATTNIIENDKAINSKATTGSALTGKNIIPGGKLYAKASTTGVVTLSLDGITSAEQQHTW